MTLITTTPDAQAAHYLLSELRTRIAMQPLPYQYGIESRALESLWEVFGIARQAMKNYPGCKTFAQITTDMLNVDMRPVTAKWHRAHKSGLLDSKDGANEFRIDLAKLQEKLVVFSGQLQEMAYGEKSTDKVCPPVLSEHEIQECFTPINFGIDADSKSGIENHNEINKLEKLEIQNRRSFYSINRPINLNAIGLSLSGGGIRSSTFCLGVVQVLANRNLLKDFDYLSTVSGGGYTGGLITSQLSNGKKMDDLSNPYGPDTSSIRYVRQNAKYLSSVNIKQRFSMAISLIIGLVLNWTGLLFILSNLALIFSYYNFFSPSWLNYALISSGITLALTLLYGTLIRSKRLSNSIFKSIEWGGGITLTLLMAHLVQQGYFLFIQDPSFYIYLISYLAFIIIAAPSAIRFLPVFGKPSIKKVVLKISLIVASTLAPLFATLIFYSFLELGSLDSTNSSLEVLPFSIEGSSLLLILSFIFGLVTYFVDINLTGLNPLYKNLISRTFLKVSGDSDKELTLTELNVHNTAPYHLINATVNLPDSNSRVLRDRRGDFFIFSKHWSGSAATGYLKTGDWLPNMDLATALAISGAATSPQMGTQSKPALSALMTILNVRLGYWIQNLNNPEKKKTKYPGVFQLISEMFGSKMSEKNKWLYLSDGGHIENLGLYELLRRRCKFIVCVDGESDPESTFEGKLTLVRHAQIDFGIRIEPRLDDIRLNPESSFSKTHSHLLRVHYPPRTPGEKAEIGLMLYFKLSLTGDEAELLKRYRKINPTFPHQTTLDQFYDEEQFEVYRQLGVHVAEGAFSPAILTACPQPTNVEEWFKELAKNMLEPTTLNS
jgi:hypothetical protein